MLSSDEVPILPCRHNAILHKMKQHIPSNRFRVSKRSSRDILAEDINRTKITLLSFEYGLPQKYMYWLKAMNF